MACGDVVAVGEPGLLEVGRVGRRGGGGADPLDRGVEVPEGLAGDDGGDLGADAEGDDRLVGDQQPARLGHRLEDRGGVERGDGAQVDHLDRDALGGEGLGRGEGLVDHPRHRHDGDVAALPHDAGRADGDEVVGGRLRPLHPVEQAVLDEDHRVGVLDRRPQQAVGVRRGRRHDDAEPGDVGEQRLEALGVLAARRPAGAELGADGQRHLRRAAGHERQLRRLVEQLVEADADEVEVHQLDHRPHAGHRRADAEAHDRRLRDRRVPHPVAEPVAQAAGEPEDVAAVADVDAGDEHPLVGLELGLERRRGWRPSCGTPARRRRRPAARAARASGRTTKSNSVVGAGLGQRRGPPRRRRRAPRPPTASSAAIASSSTPAARSRRAWTTSGSRASHSSTLLGRPVALRVALVVAVPPVGRRLDDDGAAAGPDARRPRPAWPTRWPRRRCRRPRRSSTP